jgi:hypothetical protein
MGTSEARGLPNGTVREELRTSGTPTVLLPDILPLPRAGVCCTEDCTEDPEEDEERFMRAGGAGGNLDVVSEFLGVTSSELLALTVLGVLSREVRGVVFTEDFDVVSKE